MWLSARTGEGVDALATAVGERFEASGSRRELRLPPGSGRTRARLYDLGAVLNERPCEDGGSIVEVRIAERDLARLGVDAGCAGPVEAPAAGEAGPAFPGIRFGTRVRAS